MSYLARLILASSVVGVSNERVFSIAGDAYKSNQHFDPETFGAMMVLNRYFFKENLELYRFEDLLDDDNLTKEELDVEIERRKEEMKDRVKGQYISDAEENSENDAIEEEEEAAIVRSSLTRLK